jgi:Pectinesterase
MKKLGGLMFTLAAATLAHEASAADLNVCQSGCPFPTIQSAINSSHANDVIHIAAGTYFENLQVPNQRLTFVGAGQDLTVIDGRRRGTVVTLGAFGDSTTAQTVSIIAVTITHGSAQYGGGIRINDAALDLQNSIVSSNAATVNGGGIDVGAFTVPAKITSSMVIHNRAAGAGGGIAVEVECVAQISNSSIARNTAGTSGGGVFAEGASQSTIQGTTISDNTSQHDGGGIYLDSGMPKAHMSITTSSVVGNHAAVDGGGILDAGALTLDASVVLGNNLPTDILR